MKLSAKWKCRVLVSTDELTMKSLLNILPSDQFTVRLEEHPMAFLESHNLEEADLLILDSNLEHSLDACAAVKGDPRTRELPLLIISDENLRGLRAESLEAGADDLLLRPFESREILARIFAQFRASELRTQVQKLQETQRALFQLSTLTNPLLTPEKVLNALCQKTAELTGMSLVLVTTGDAKTWEINAACDRQDGWVATAIADLGNRVWEVLEAREPVCHDEGPGPYLGIPLQGSDGSIRGVLHAFGGAIVPAQNRLELLSIVSQRICNELQIQEYNQRLREEVDLRTQELRFALKDLATANRKLIQAGEDTMRHLATAANYHDTDTGAHIDRMAEYAEIIAKHLGWDEDHQRLMSLAAPMHDVGKIGIPDTILKKQGQLSDEEWEHMKDHPTMGAQILSGSSSKVLQMAEVIALTHHERYDGGGYPRGLLGEEIPLPGRIVALADVFDALTTPRAYKKAWTLEEALVRLRDESGKHFDPKVIEAFFQALPEIIEVYNQGREEPVSADSLHEFAA